MACATARARSAPSGSTPTGTRRCARTASTASATAGWCSRPRSAPREQQQPVALEGDVPVAVRAWRLAVAAQANGHVDLALAAREGDGVRTGLDRRVGARE